MSQPESPLAPRPPRAFRVDDPALQPETGGDIPELQNEAETDCKPETVTRTFTTADFKRGVRWSGLLISAMGALASLAAGLWFTRFVSIALQRNDWIGWTATALMAVIGLSLAVILLRELAGFRRLARLSRLRKIAKSAMAAGDTKDEREAIALLARHYAGRSDLKWGLARLKNYAGDVLQPGELLRLADRELLAPIDTEARRIILKSAKRVATVSALSPIMWIAVGYVLVENVRLFRAVAGLYGGRPGVLGALRLGRLIVTHIVATGGLALTDDLLGQFLGQDVLRRLSRRLGEGAFNGALTSRLGVAAIEVLRPLPFLDAEPIRVREIFAELMRSLRASPAAAGGTVKSQARP